MYPPGGGDGGAESEEELEDRFKKKVTSRLRSRVSTSGRKSTRLATASARKPYGRAVEPPRDDEDEAPSAPPRVPRKEKVWDELTRPSWYPWTRAAVLAKMPPGKKPNTYICTCKKFKDGHEVAAEDIEVDHKQDWKTYILGTAGGDDSVIITNDDAKKAYNDLKDLQGMCGPSNSSKSGPRGKY